MQAIDTPPFNGSKGVLSNFDRFTPSKICLILKDIEEKKSTGSDNISVKVLKKTLPYIINILCDMFNCIVIDAHSELSNLKNKKKFFIVSSLVLKLVFPALHRSTNLSQILLSCKKQNGFTVALFLDFCKAFDCVDHSILRNKLKSINILEPSFDLFYSFLSDGLQFVRFNGYCSDPKPISIGEPQGSIVAPTLFLIYINELLRLPLTSSSYAYADDTVFLLVIGIQTLLNMYVILIWREYIDGVVLTR
mgnify:FL=1